MPKLIRFCHWQKRPFLAGRFCHGFFVHKQSFGQNAANDGSEPSLTDAAPVSNDRFKEDHTIKRGLGLFQLWDVLVFH